MMEAKDILALCERYRDYMSITCYRVLRLRYNGKRLLLPKDVAEILGVRRQQIQQYEDEGLKQLALCRDLEAAGEPLVAIRYASSFTQPVAALILTGLRRHVWSTWRTIYRGELLIHAPIGNIDIANLCPSEIKHFCEVFMVDHISRLPHGCIIGRAYITDCDEITPSPRKDRFLLTFKHPQLFHVPIAYSGEPRSFYVPANISATLPPRYPFSTPPEPLPV
jgi:hypothetical protein